MIDYNRQYEHLNLRDKKDPKSIINLCPSWLAKQLEVIPDEVFMYSEEQLREKCKPFPREEKLRISFWQEYFRISNSKRPQQLNISNICGGICDHRTFQVLVRNSYMLAFILCAPPEVNNSLEEIMQLGFKRMRDLMIMAPVDGEGKFDKSIAEMQYKIYNDALNRRRGPVTNKIETSGRSLNLHKHQLVQAPEAPPTVDFDIEAHIAADEAANTPVLIEDTTPEMKALAIEVHSEVLANEPQEV